MSQMKKQLQRPFGSLKAAYWILFMLCNIERTGSFFSDEPPDCLKLSLCTSETTKYRNCKCDSRCHIFNDCCVDATEFNTTLLKYNVTEMQEALSCDTSLANGGQSPYVVNKCPNETDELIKQRCISNITEDVLTLVPVSGVETGIVFRNMYCAFCHGAMQVENVLFWKVAIDCEVDEPRKDNSLDEQLNLTYALSLINIGNCDRNYFTPKGPPLPRLCRPILDHCSPDWMDEVVAKECSSYTNYTYGPKLGTDGIAYRNWHCAICNYAPESKLECKDFDQGTGPIGGLPSMRLLLDINSGHLTRLEKIGPFYSKKMRQTGKGTLEKCTENRFFDVFQGVCRSVFCEAGTHADRNEECLPDVYASSKNSKFSLGGNITCALTRLNASEYEQYRNGTVHVIARDLILHTGDYLPSQNETGIAICAHYLSQRTVTYTDTVQMYFLEGYLTTAGYTLSLAGLLTLFILYMFLPELRNLPGKCLMNLVGALFLAQLLFLLINIPRPNSIICKMLSTATHYLYMAAFFWMNVLGFDIWRTFQFQLLSHKSNGKGRKMMFYHVYAWGMPLLVVTAAVLFDEVLPVSDDIRPRYGNGVCWFNTKWGLLYFFAVPVALLLAANIVFFSLAVFNICRTSCATSLVSGSLSKKRHLLLVIKLSAIMGLTWTIGFLAILLPDSSALWNAFVITGSLQGVVICLGFACNQKTFRLLKEKIEQMKKKSLSTTDMSLH